MAVPIIGTARIDRLGGGPPAFRAAIDELKIPQPKTGRPWSGRSGTSRERDWVFQVLCARAMCCGRAMVIAYDLNTVQEYGSSVGAHGPVDQHGAHGPMKRA